MTRALVMELVAGSALSVPQPREPALNCARQIEEAMGAAHEMGITHRHLVRRDDFVKVLDFGLASVASRGDPKNSPTMTLTATHTRMIMGTAAYVSTEQALRHLELRSCALRNADWSEALERRSILKTFRRPRPRRWWSW